MWQDPEGNFHALFHSFIKDAVGGHAFSLDGTNWTFGGKRTFIFPWCSLEGTVGYSPPRFCPLQVAPYCSLYAENCTIAFPGDVACFPCIIKGNGFLQDGAYSLDVEVALQDQGNSTTTVTLARRERPHLLLDAVGNPIALTNGVQPPDGGSGGGGGGGGATAGGGVDTKDWTYTAVFLINSA